MIPGPELVYKCPQCGKYSIRGSLISGNTIDSRLYSDGKRIAPMLPEFPSIIKCKKCKTFFWLNIKNKVGECRWRAREEVKKEWKDAYKAEFLTVEEYNEAINLKIYNNDNEQKFLRIRLWWTINDKTRDRYNNCITEDEKNIYIQNCTKLIEMLDKNQIEEKIMTAELFRNLGNFIKCNDILETITDEKYIWIKKILNKECVENNKRVIKINNSNFE